jgi:nudix-type nucleoside diphosphatase (YffH/AdpP family)
MSEVKVVIESEEILSDDWYLLKKTTFKRKQKNGQWQSVTRESYDRGNGATILLYNLQLNTVVLTRQFRYPTYVNGNTSGELVETAAGLLDSIDPASRISLEVEEETGYRVSEVKPVFEAYMSPGSVTERLYFFVATYEEANRVSQGGGIQDEGEDIEVLEIDFSQALAMIDSGEICDGKTIMLLQYAALNLFVESVSEFA